MSQHIPKLYNHRRHVVATKAIPWSQIPGETPDEKREYLQRQIADLAASGQYTPAQIYSIVMPEMPGSIRSALPEPLKDTRKQYELLMKERQVANEIVSAFQGDLGRIIELGLAIFNQRYVPQLASYLPFQRKNETHINTLKSIEDEDHLIEARKVIQQDRDAALNQIRERLLALKTQLAETYQIDDVEFVHLLWATTIKGYDKVGTGDIGTFTTQRVPDPENQKAIFNMIKSVIAEINNKNKTAIGMIWSGLDTSPEAKRLWPTPQPLTKEVALQELGFVESRFPRQPSDYFEHDGKKTGNKELFDNPENISRLQAIIEGGFMDGNGLGLITNEGARSDDFNTFSERVLYWVYRTYCRKSKPEFAALLSKIGFDHLIEKVYKEQAIPDPDYQSMGLNFRSAEEKLIVEALRQEFGLQAVSYPLEIPVPQGCPTNSQMFVVDFLIPCDVLVGLNEDGHPQIERQVVFVGEYFGFDSNKELEIPEGEVWTLPDGSVARATKGDSNVELRGGVKTTVGEKYRVRTEWKKMVETAVAELTGNKALHLSKRDLQDTSRRNLMSQLDALAIIYHSNRCPADDRTCAVALHNLVAHLQSGCSDPDCPARNYVRGETQEVKIPAMNPMEAYILSAFTELKMRYAFVPAVTFATENSYNRETLWAYIQHRNQIMKEMEELQQAYQKRYQEEGETPDVRELRRKLGLMRQQYNNLSASPAASIYNQFQAKIQGDEGYYRRAQALQKLLDTVRSGKSISPAQIKDQVKMIFDDRASTKRASHFNWSRFLAG